MWDHPCDDHFRKVYAEGTIPVFVAHRKEKNKWLAQQREDLNRSLTDDLRARPTLSPLRAPVTPIKPDMTPASRKKVSFADELRQQEEAERQQYLREYQARREAWQREIQDLEQIERQKFDRERNERVLQWRRRAEELEREEKSRFESELSEWKSKLELQKNQEISDMIKVVTRANQT